MAARPVVAAGEERPSGGGAEKKKERSGEERALGAVLGRDPEGSAGINFFLRKKNSLFYLVMNPSLFLDNGDNETVFVDLSDSQYWTHNFHKWFEASFLYVYFGLNF